MYIEEKTTTLIEDLLAAIRLLNIVRDKKGIIKCVRIAEFQLNWINQEYFYRNMTSTIYRTSCEVLQMQKAKGLIFDFTAEYDLFNGGDLNITIETLFGQKFYMCIRSELITKGQFDNLITQITNVEG